MCFRIACCLFLWFRCFVRHALAATRPWADVCRALVVVAKREEPLPFEVERCGEPGDMADDLIKSPLVRDAAQAHAPQLREVRLSATNEAGED